MESRVASRAGDGRPAYQSIACATRVILSNVATKSMLRRGEATNGSTQE